MKLSMSITMTEEASLHICSLFNLPSSNTSSTYCRVLKFYVGDLQKHFFFFFCYSDSSIEDETNMAAEQNIYLASGLMVVSYEPVELDM